MDNIEINVQSSVKIIGSKIIYFDPFQIKEENHDADIIFITHNHYDHYDVDSIDKIIKSDTIIVAPESMQKEIKYKNDKIFTKPQNKYKVSNIEIETVSSYNMEKPFHPKENNWVGYIINLDNTTYYIPGDTDVLEENKNIKVDVAFIPIGGKFTMNYEESAKYINLIKPKIVIPYHYGSIIGSINLGSDFSKLLDSNIKCVLKIK